MASCKIVTDKKEDHKLIERKRRRDMKSLCSVLTSLISAHLKEKHSLSDQLAAAAFYIHELEKNVQDLEEKRERLNILTHIEKFPERVSCNTENGEINAPIDSSSAFPMVKLTNVGLEMHVTVGTFKQTVPLWSLLEVLEGGGLEVEAALQSSVNDKIFYTLQCKISDVLRFDNNVIYERLWQLVREHRSPFQHSTS